MSHSPFFLVIISHFPYFCLFISVYLRHSRLSLLSARCSSYNRLLCSSSSSPWTGSQHQKDRRYQTSPTRWLSIQWQHYHQRCPG